jgi:CDP-diglyceride synthetase
MDESDLPEPEDQSPAEPITERVRIYGAEPAGSMMGPGSAGDEASETDSDGEVRPSEAPSSLGTEPDDPETLFAWRASGTSGSTSGEVPRYLTEEPSGGLLLPHWTEPPTGQVPTIVDRRANDSDLDPLAAGGGPSWREHDHEWDDGGYDPSFLADDESRLGALDDKPLEERRPWEFDDLSPSGRVRATGRGSGLPASGASHAHSGSRGEPGGWWEEDTEEVRIDDFAPSAQLESRRVESRPVDRGEFESREVETRWDAPSSLRSRGALDVDEPGEVQVDHYGEESEGSDYPDAGGRITQPVMVRASMSSAVAEEGTGPGDTLVATISSSPLRGQRGRGPAAARRRARARRPPSRPPDHSADGHRHRAGRSVPLAIATGLGFALVALLCFAEGALATLVLSTLVVTLAAAECYAALRRSGRRPATLLGLVATVAVMVSVYAKGVAALPLVLALLVMTSMVWYVVGAERGPAVEGIATTVLAFAWVGVLGAFAALMLAPSQYPHDRGVAFLLGAVVATVGADVGALVVGRWAGRHPLAARVSPHKTWEGFVGGAVLAVAASVVITGHVHPWTVPKAAVLGVVVAVLAPVGDLCESLIKRDLGLKDMGSILPGHGGILDRVDALLFVLPATYYLVRILHLG